MSTPHTHFPRGTHVFVILKSGDSFEDKFWSNEKDRIVLVSRGEVRIKHIRSMSYRKLQDGSKKERK